MPAASKKSWSWASSQVQRCLATCYWIRGTDMYQQSRREEEPTRLQTRTAAVCRYSCSELWPHLPPVAPHRLRNSCLFQKVGHRCEGLRDGGILAVSCVCNTREQQHQGCNAAMCPHASSLYWCGAQIEACCRPRAQMVQLQQEVLPREDSCTTEMQSWVLFRGFGCPFACAVMSPTTGFHDTQPSVQQAGTTQ